MSVSIMAKKSMIEREKKRVRETNKYSSKRKLLLEQFRSANDYDLKLKIHFEIQKLPRNSAKVRIRKRCWKTGRSRGYYKDFGLSRHVLREMAHQCLLPGVTKSSW